MQEKGIPYWFIVIIIAGLLVLYALVTSPDYQQIFWAIGSGLLVTISVALVAYLIALLAGLGLAAMRLSQYRILRELATLYIEVVRGLPMLVILYYIAFVLVPLSTDFLNAITAPLIKLGYLPEFSSRSTSFLSRAILALSLAYAAFIAEIFRAGFESIPKGQLEAALALGLSRRQAFLHILLPQAFRNVQPALVNESISVIKDSSLVSILGVQDITQLAKVYSASTFKFFETYNVVAFFYLALTISLSMLTRKLNSKQKIKGH